MIVDASAPTYMLTHWARDRKRGPGLPLEYVVKRQTSETADFFGFHDRGRLLPGKRAEGYEMTLVAGIPVFERGEHTGAKLGRLVRRGR